MAQTEYATLRAFVEEQGLLRKQPLYHVTMVALSLLLVALSVLWAWYFDNPILQLFNAALLAFAFVQIAFISHDSGHRQVFSKPWQNDIVGFITADLLLGMSYTYWLDKHNRHHANPNQEDTDPDIDLPILAFSPQQALEKRGIARWIVQRQSVLFFAVLALTAFSIRGDSIKYLIRHPARTRALEMLLMAIHYTAYFGLAYYHMGVLYGTIGIILHQLLFGLYLGSVFAPNHKGMMLLARESALDFLRRQVLTARNVRAHPITDFWYGGLNYQIEHHLFPTMPRNKLRKAKKIVQEFCARHGISYHETSIAQSYREILQYLREVSAPLRTTS